MSFLITVFLYCSIALTATTGNSIFMIFVGLTSRIRFPTRIVGGEECRPNELPYQISIRFDLHNHICGGSLITPQHVLTAAHCAELGNQFSLIVKAGEHHLQLDDGTEQLRQLISIRKHPLYNSATMENDIAILKVDYPFNVNEYVQPIGLSMQDQSSSGDAVVSGWGSLHEGGSIVSTLRKVTVPIVSDTTCRSYYGTEFVNSMICAGLPQGGKDSCNGDSGGPLVCGNGTFQCGIVSWGIGCARPNYPGVYTEVSAFRNWIDANAT